MGISIRYDKNAVEHRVRSSLKKKKQKRTKKKPKKKTKKNKEQREKKGSFPNRSTIKATDRFTGVKIND